MQPNSHSGNDAQQPGRGAGGGALLGRLMWMALGPILSVVMLHAIVTRGGWLTVFDAVFAVVVALMVLGRWAEQRSGAAMTATGEPAGEGHFSRYVRVLLPLAIGVWLAANVLGNHILA